MTQTRFRPIGGRILIELDEAPEKTGSILVPPTARDREQFQTQEAVIVDVSFDAFAPDKGFGEDERLRPGQRILIVKHAGSPVPGSKTQRVLNDKDVLGVERTVQ